MFDDKDYYTIEEAMYIMIYGSDEEKKQVLASMIYVMNIQLDHLENTLKRSKGLWN